jgi:hypothetical protein
MPRLHRLAFPVIGVAVVVFLIHSFSSSSSSSKTADVWRSYTDQSDITSPLPLDKHSHVPTTLSSADKRGLVTYEPTSKRHPIELLIENAKIQAQQLQARINSIETLEDAVADYKDAYGMTPPKGFNQWLDSPHQLLLSKLMRIKVQIHSIHPFTPCSSSRITLPLRP